MAPPNMVFRWRKSSHSGENGQCVELGRSAPTWRKSSRSGENGSCVELAYLGAVRDSKNPDGVHLGFSAQVWREFATRIKDGNAG